MKCIKTAWTGFWTVNNNLRLKKTPAQSCTGAFQKDNYTINLVLYHHFAIVVHAFAFYGDEVDTIIEVAHIDL